MRSCGILMHITSLPSPYGIGTLGTEAERFADWLKLAGQKYWQVLPIGPTGYGDSPYQPFSSFAGNPLLIDLDDLVANGMLARQKIEELDFGDNPSYVDYAKINKTKILLLKEAFKSFNEDTNFKEFEKKERFWLDDYALFTALKGRYDQKPWSLWSDDIRRRDPEILDKCAEGLSEEIRFVKFVQYMFFVQWDKFRRCCAKNDIKIIGDIPIYVSPDCADVWANPELFELDEDLYPKRVAGVPPDYFSATGQLWGNPLYNWDAMKKDGYKWWLQRIKKSAEIYDMLRIDHFRAFDTYYAIPFGEPTAEHGVWEKGPGMDLFNTVKKELGDVNIIAEDLGDIFDSVKELLKESGFPGMKVLQFGFNSEYKDSDFLPHNYPENVCAYTGTHDNATVMEWYREADENTRAMTRRYLKPAPFERMNMCFIRAVYASPAKLAIVPMQDVIGLGKEARMNIPSTVGGNWMWRMKQNELTEARAENLKDLAETYFRN